MYVQVHKSLLNGETVMGALLNGVAKGSDIRRRVGSSKGLQLCIQQLLVIMLKLVDAMVQRLSQLAVCRCRFLFGTYIPLPITIQLTGSSRSRANTQSDPSDTPVGMIDETIHVTREVSGFMALYFIIDCGF